MDKIPINFTDVRFTALLQLYLRWLDSKERHPILGDSWAEQVVNRLDFDFSGFTSADLGRYNVGPRSRIMDRWVTEFLSNNPDAVVVDLGCGFDSRVFRVDPAPDHHWYDVDFPDVNEIARQLYPERAGHTRIGVSVLDPDWLSTIPGDRPVAVVVDGLFMFLAEEEVRRVFQQILDHFPSGEFGFNTYSSVLKERSRKRPGPIFGKYGVTLTWALDDERAVEKFDGRLHYVEEEKLGPSWFAHAPLHIRAMFAVLGAIPSARNSTRILRYRF
jgi:O-methyltransferase involved in polyketide biosynthesis